MRIVVISDTHGRHRELPDLEGDVLIHCGDFCNGFKINEQDLADVDEWFAQLSFKKIIVIGGNHDFVAQRKHREKETVFQNAAYLVDEPYQYQGVNFYGSPWIPELDGWAYYLSHDDRKKKWELIPPNTDILITHTPPRGILDKPRSGQSVGCTHLREKTETLSPKIHCFGHIHASYGVHRTEQTTFYNASSVDSNFEVGNPPFKFDLESAIQKRNSA